MIEGTVVAEPTAVKSPDLRERTTMPALKDGIDNAMRSWVQDMLPIMTKYTELQEAFRKHDRVILEAETGSGKSTAAPVILLDELLETNPDAKIIVSQPRKIATENLAQYVGEKVGKNYVGYRHKDSPRPHPDTRITYAVEGSLLKELLDDPLLTKYDAVILDEIHERSTNIDIIMPLVKKAQEARALASLKDPKLKKLKLVLTSATVNRDEMLNYFDGMHPVEVPGKMFPVKKNFLTDPLNPDNPEEIDIPKVVQAAATTVDTILKKTGAEKEDGDILIFMPGRAEIDSTIAALKNTISDADVEFIPLLGGDDSKDADAYKRSTTKRKIIVATNVAETSLTIPTVRIVIDSGLMRTNIYNEDTGITELVTQPHTQSNARQREGRAGRVAKGHVYYLFTEPQLLARKPYLTPKILESNIASQVLLMKQMGIDDVHNFDFLSHPGKEKIDQAVQSLQKLGALDETGAMTETGRQMTEYDTDPHFARMLVEAEKRNCSEAVSLMIGLMSSCSPVFDRNFKPKAPFAEKYMKFIVPDSDFLTHLRIWNEYVAHDTSPEDRKAWSEENGINTLPLYLAANERRDLLANKPELRRSLRKAPVELTPQTMRDISVCMAAGLIDQSLKQELLHTYKLEKSGTGGITLDRNSVLNMLQPPQLLTGKIRTIEAKPEQGKPKQILASFNMAATQALIEEAVPHLFQKKEAALATPVPPPAAEPQKSVEQPSQPKPEQAKTEPPPAPAVIKPPEIRPIPPPPQPVATTNGRHPPEMPGPESPPPKTLWQRVKQIARTLTAPIRYVWRKIKRFFTGKE